jgi:hypothetical protein
MLAVAQFLAPILLVVAAIIHLGVLLQLLPHQMVWGSRIKSRRQLFNLGVPSLLANLFFLWVVVQAAEFIPVIIGGFWLKVLLWLMSILFALNTLGNISSPNTTEKLIFTPLAMLLAASCFVLAIG